MTNKCMTKLEPDNKHTGSEDVRMSTNCCTPGLRLPVRNAKKLVLTEHVLPCIDTECDMDSDGANMSWLNTSSINKRNQNKTGRLQKKSCDPKQDAGKTLKLVLTDIS